MTETPAARIAYLRQRAVDLTDSAEDRIYVIAEWSAADGDVVVRTLLSEDRRRPAGDPYSDQVLTWVRDHSASRGMARAARYLLDVLTDPADRRRAADAGWYYNNIGLAARYADAVYLAARDIAAGRGLYERPEDRMRREDPAYARQLDQMLYREAQASGIA